MQLSELPELARAQVAVKNPADGAELGVLLYRADAKTVLAYSNICTHQGCAVSPKSAKNDFYCACHGSRFLPTDGTASAGPAISPLTRFACEIKGKDIVVFVPEDS